MTATVGRLTTATDHDLMGGYLDHVTALGLSDRAMRDRLGAARAFLARHPDLGEWMTLPVRDRVSELARGGVWPLLVHAIATGWVRLDLDLAGAKNLTGLGRAVEAADPTGAFGILRRAGADLGWTTNWVETVLHECLAVILAWHGGTTTALTAAGLDDFDAAMAGAMTVPDSTKKAYRCRLASLRQLLYQTRILDEAPRRRPWARTIDERLAAVKMAPPNRTVLVRYIHTRAIGATPEIGRVTGQRPATVRRLPHQPPPRPAHPRRPVPRADRGVPGL